MVTCNSLPPPWTAAHQAPLSAGLPRQEDWSELPFPSPGDLPNSGIELVSPALAGAFFTAELPGKPFEIICSIKIFGASLVAQNSLVVKSSCNVGDWDSIPGLGKSPEEGNDYLLQHSCLENSMDRGAWWTTVHGVTKSQTWIYILPWLRLCF